MAVRVGRSARKRRVGASRIREVMAAAGVPELLEDGKLLYVGTDSRGVEVEVVAILDDKQPGRSGRHPRHANAHDRKEGRR